MSKIRNKNGYMPPGMASFSGTGTAKRIPDCRCSDSRARISLAACWGVSTEQWVRWPPTLSREKNAGNMSLPSGRNTATHTPCVSWITKIIYNQNMIKINMILMISKKPIYLIIFVFIQCQAVCLCGLNLVT